MWLLSIVIDMTEAELLTLFFDAVGDIVMGENGRYERLTWIGHNVIEFDLRFLKQRAMVNNVRPTVVIPADARHGNNVFDTMKEWAGWKGYVSLDKLAKAFGFEGKEGMSGTDVWPAFQAGEYEKIAEYNKSDVELTRKVYRRMVWK